MGLNSMLKIIVNHLKKYYIVFTAIWFTLGVLLFIPIFGDSDSLIALVLLTFLITSVIFILFIGITMFGCYAKTFVFIQNNRKNFILTTLIVETVTAFLLTLLTAFLRLNSIAASFLVPFNLTLGLLLLLFYLCIFNLGGLYGLFINYKPFRKRIFFFILIFVLCFLGLLIIPMIGLLIEKIIVFDPDYNHIYYLIAFGIFNIALTLINSIYYLKLNTIKAYSNE